MASTPEDLITIGEAARRLGVSVRTVRRWSDAGRLQVYRTPGNQRRYHRADVESAIAPAHPDKGAA